MTVCARFDTFHVSKDGQDIVYGGRTADQGKVEIRQATADADVMIVLLASVFEKARNLAGGADHSHATEAARVEAAPNGDLVVSLVSRDVTRAFRLDRGLAAQLSADMAAAVRRPHLRAVT